MTGATSKLVYRAAADRRPEDPPPDITRARTLLNWEPTVQIEEGLVDTIKYFRAKIEKAEAAHER